MIFYLDTSVVVASLTNETRTGKVQGWLGRQKPGTLVVSDWVVTEFSSALSIKLRTRQIGASDRAAALSMFARLLRRSFRVLPVTAVHFRTAAGYTDRHALMLTAGDALHLAVVASEGATLCTLDGRLAKAGAALAIGTRLL